ncbi:MAG TPA: hypothetical protein VIF38_12100 [Burkholderiales bacterium]
MIRARAALFAVAALALAGCVTTGGTAGDAAVLLGRWVNVNHTLYFSDGTTGRNPPSMQCWVEFSERQAVSECVNNGGRHKVVSAIRLVAPGQYESEVIENMDFPDFVGSRFRTDFRMEGGKLFTTSYPPVLAGKNSKVLVRVESEWARETGIRRLPTAPEERAEASFPSVSILEERTILRYAEPKQVWKTIVEKTP